MWILMLNDMRSAHFEDLEPVARAATKEALVELVKREQVETYKGEGPNAYKPTIMYSKNFREGGPLEWFNLPFGDRHFVDVGDADQNHPAIVHLLVVE
jgi:hypothetical protein